MMHETPRVGGSQSTDAELLLRFCQHRDSAALGELVDRHARMVLSVCRHALGDTADADDAFQATFLILLRRAESIQRRGSVGSWLYRVAYRSAVRLARRRRREAASLTDAAEVAMHDDALAAIQQQALVDALYEELDRMPERYRAPLVLFHLEGLPRREAAAALEVTDATIKGLLVRGRRMLRLRLARRGVAFTLAASAVGAATATAQGAEVARLVELTIDAATLYVHPPAAAGGSSAVSHACQLADQGVRAMFVSTAVKFTAVGTLAACVSLAWIARDTVVAAAGPGAAPETNGAVVAVEVPADDVADGVAEEMALEAIAVEFAPESDEPTIAAAEAIDVEDVRQRNAAPADTSTNAPPTPRSASAPLAATGAISPTSDATQPSSPAQPAPVVPRPYNSAQATPAATQPISPYRQPEPPQYQPQPQYQPPIAPPAPAAQMGEEERKLRIEALEHSVRAADAMRRAYMTLSEAKQLESAAIVNPANGAMEKASSLEARGQSQMFEAEALKQEVEKHNAMAERARLMAIALQPVVPTSTPLPASEALPTGVESYSTTRDTYILPSDRPSNAVPAPSTSAPTLRPTEPTEVDLPSYEPVEQPAGPANAALQITSNETSETPVLDDVVRPGGRLHIEVVGALPDAPIRGVYQVEPGGTVALGARYGRINVADMSLIEAEDALRRRLSEILEDPQVQITLPGTTPENSNLPPPYTTPYPQ